MKKVSIIVPIYNVEQYLEACLDSVVGQTIGDYEIICVDDGSTDQSGEIVKKYAARYDNILLIQKQNGGLSSARNAGLDIAQGKYVYFLDSDDYIEKNALEELYNIAEEQQLDLIYFNTEAFYENEDVKEKHPKYQTMYQRKHTYTDGCTGQTMFAQMCKNGEFLCNVGIQFFRRDVFEEHNLRFYPGIIYEDELFTFQFAMLSKKVTYVDQIYHHRRVHEGSIVTTPRSMKNVESHLHSYIEAISFVDTLEIESAAIPYVKTYIYKIYRVALNGFIHMRRKGVDTRLEDKAVVYQVVYEMLQKDAQKERKLKKVKTQNLKLECENTELQKQNVNLQEQITKLKNQLINLKSCRSYRIGRAITYIPRKIKKYFSNL